MFLSRFAACALGAALALTGGLAAAQEWPSRPIRIVVTFPTGGAPDILARLFSEKSELGQPVIVDNKPGAGGNIGADIVAKSPADGYTLVMGTVGTHSINGSIFAKMPYDMTRDFAPISLIASTPNLLVVNNDLVTDVPDTYEAMLDLAQELTTPDTFGFMFEDTNFYYAYAWLRTHGGYVFGRDDSDTLVPTDVGLATEGAVAGAQALKDLRFARGLIPSGTTFDVANGLFVDGALAMIYTGPWSIPQYQDAGLDVSVVPVPPLADGTPFSGFMGVQGALVNQFSSAKVEAANFAKWLTRSDAQVSLARLSGRIPASISALGQVTDDPIIAGFGAALLNSEPMPNIPEMGAVWSPMGNALTVMTDSADSDVSALLTQAVDEILGR